MTETYVLAFIALVSVWLAVIDQRTQLIPNKILVPSFLVSVLLLAFASWNVCFQALACAGLGFALLLLLNLLTRGKIGMGDVKLAALLGLGLGVLGWRYWLLGLSLGFVFGGIGAAVLLSASRGRVGLKSYFAYGPYLVAGAFVAGAFGCLGL